MRRPWPVWLRITISVLAVPVIFSPFGGYWWARFLMKPFGPGPNDPPVFALSPINYPSYWVDCLTWRYAFAIPEAVVGAVLSILIYRVSA